ncbi:MAG: amino acid adenylation domain-containing protein, partial [Acidobacteria bacterium]|nr:amino acid adenylation domain-containing protein [Acidobacteriota bacterium]
LVQIFFVLQNAPVEGLKSSLLRFDHVPSGLKTVKGDMFLSLTETGNGLDGQLEYNTDLFDAATIENFFEHLKILLDAAATSPELTLSRLPLLTAVERQRILVDWNATQSPYPKELCAHQLFERQVERTPESIAISFRTEEITYRELNRRANQLARHLRRRGVARDSLVALYLERSLDMLVALLGVLKAGGAYVPLDPLHPPERVAFILEDARVQVLITQRSLLDSLAMSRESDILCLDSDAGQIFGEDGENLEPLASPEHLAYVLYTSGSTGKPKGVEIEHRNLVNFLISMQKQPGLVSEDRLLAVTTLSFDIAGLELYLPLICGAQIVLASREEAANAEQLLAAIKRAAPTIMQATPATWRMLVDAGWKGSKAMRVLCGGEALAADLGLQLRTRCHELWNLYGPTETTIWSSLYRIDKDLTSSAPIGRPIANTALYVLDQNLVPVPVGVAGELYIGGDGVARGYRNRPELTKEKFILNPFSNSGDRIYRTGDVAKYFSDGNIAYLGRSDFQVKIRGFRIELGEIENALLQHPSIRQVVVAAYECKPDDKRLVAYLVLDAGEHLTLSELRAHLKQSLPDYMIPSALVEMDSLPLTPNGKVDRKRLPAPDYHREFEGVAGRKPRNATEEILWGIWADVLGVEPASTEDDFFLLGGHSLLATKLVSRIRETLKVDLPLRTLFETPVLAALAVELDSLLRQKGAELPAAILPAPRSGPLPLSLAQQRLWFLDQLESGNPLYNIAYVTRIRGPLNELALEKSLNEVIRRHECLRTVFSSVNDHPTQVIRPMLEMKLNAVDLSGFARAEEREAEARRLATEEIKKPFDLATGPLIRPLLMKIDSLDHALVLSMHHIISDRWSIAILSQEIAALYAATIEGSASPLPELKIQYADYACWQHEFLSPAVLDQQLSFWREHLAGAPPVLELPTDHPRQNTEQFWGAQHHQAIPAPVVRDLRALSRKQRGTFFMTLLAAFEILLAKLTGQQDVVVGIDLANRTHLETEALIGFFVNLLPLRARLHSEMSFRDFFAQVRESCLGAMTHQDIPFDKLVEALRPERSLSHNPLVQVLFVMQNTPQTVQEFAGLRLEPLGVSSSSRFDLVVFINNPQTDPSVTWMYNPKLFEASTIARMADAYELVLNSMFDDPDATIATLLARLHKAEETRRVDDQRKLQQAGLEKLRRVRRKAIEVS